MTKGTRWKLLHTIVLLSTCTCFAWSILLFCLFLASSSSSYQFLSKMILWIYILHVAWKPSTSTGTTHSTSLGMSRKHFPFMFFYIFSHFSASSSSSYPFLNKMTCWIYVLHVTWATCTSRGTTHSTSLGISIKTFSFHVFHFFC